MTSSSSTSRSKRLTFLRSKAVASAALALLSLALGSAAMGGIFLLTQPVALPTQMGRNYNLAPFDMIDAIEHCERQTQVQLGEALATAHLDEHSSRWDEQEGLYKIFMVAYSGESSDYKESAIHCYIDPKAHTLTHFRTIDLKNTSMVSRALQFFK